MITDALLNILLTFVNAITHYFAVQADVPISNFLTTSITTAASYYAALNMFG